MLRSPLLVIAYVLAVDIIGLVQKIVDGIQKTQLMQQALPSLFASFCNFLPPPPLPI